MGLFTPRDWQEPYRHLSDQDLLDRIRARDELAQHYVWLTHHDIVLSHMTIRLRQYGNFEQLGRAGDFARDAILLLLAKAELLGATILKQHSTIKSWLNNTAFNFLRNAIRRDQHFDRTGWTEPDTDDELHTAVAHLRDEGASAFAEAPGPDQSRIIQQGLASLPVELRTLIQTKFMDGCSWQETSALMRQLYPDHKPPFGLSYLQQTYWDRVHKKPFIKRLRAELGL